MQNTINADSVYDSIKLFLEFGGMYVIGEDKKIYKAFDNNEPVGLLINKKPTAIMVFHDRYPTGEWVVMNPYVETLGSAPERVFFFKSLSSGLGVVTKSMIARIVELCLNKNQEDIDYDKLPIINKFKDKIDDNTVNEIAAIKTDDFIKIYYDKTSHTAQIQSEVFEETCMNEYGKKIRKKTWGVIHDAIAEFYQTERVETLYIHKASIVGAQEVEATLKVFVKACKAIHEYAKLLLNKNIDVAAMILHSELISEYHDLCAWFVTSSNSSDVAEVTHPWSNTSGLPSANVPLRSVMTLGPSSSMPRVFGNPTPQNLVNVAPQSGGLITPRDLKIAQIQQFGGVNPNNSLFNNNPAPSFMTAGLIVPHC